MLAEKLKQDLPGRELVIVMAPLSARVSEKLWSQNKQVVAANTKTAWTRTGIISSLSMSVVGSCVGNKVGEMASVDKNRIC